MVGGVSVAGFRPGFGRGGMTHSFLVTMVGAGGPDAGAINAMFDVFEEDFIPSVGGAGAKAAGEPADGDAILLLVR